MALFNPGDEQLERRASIGRWQIVRASFETANQDVVIPHQLPTPDPEQVAYQQLNTTGPAILYHDGSATRARWGNGFVKLRVSVAPVVMDILLQVVAAPIGTTKLPLGEATIPGTNADTLDGLDSTSFGRSNEPYVTTASSAGLTNETVLAAGTGIDVTGATVSLDAALDDLNDVDTTGVADGDVLTYDSGSGDWVAEAPSGSGVSALDDLSDVTISSPASTQVLAYNGSAWVNTTRYPQYVIASADESVSNDTLQNDDALLFAVATSSVYVFDLLATFTTGTSDGVDVKYTFTLPASATITWYVLELGDSATAGNSMNMYSYFQESSPSTNTSGVVTTAVIPTSAIRLRGVVRTAGTAGNVQFQFAQRVSTGGTPVVRKADSFIEYTKVS